MAERRFVEVPIHNTNDVVEIECTNLDTSGSEMCSILDTEKAAMPFYSRFALEYYKQGKTEDAITVLKGGLAKARANDLTSKVPLLNLLAGISVQKAKVATVSGTATERDIQLQMAATLLTESEKISREDPRTPDQALQQFNLALRLNPTCVASLLGKARVLFSKRQFQTALGIYQRVLTLRPNDKPDPRIGIALCLMKLGHAKDARRALERAIEVDEQAVAPYVLLATMDLNAAKRLMDPRLNAQLDAGKLEEALAEGGSLLNSAMAQLEAGIRAAAGECGSADATRRPARALKTADTLAIQAEAHFQVARAHHAMRRFDLAFDAYQKSLQHNEQHALARAPDMSSAEATFQRVLEKHPKCVEVLRALGYLHARLPNNKAKAVEYYEKEMQAVADEAAEQAKRQGSDGDVAAWFDDANLFLEAGLLYEATSARKARKAYSMAAAILQRQGTGDQLPELWSNLGALRQLAGDDRELIFAEYDNAVQKCTALLESARARLGDKSGGRAAHDVQRLEGTLTTVTYNTARFYEHCGLWDRAEALYQRILQATPAYHDARLRLAHIAYYARANSSDALALLADATANDGKRALVWLLKGGIELQRKNVQDARRAYEHVLKDIAKHDVYALTRAPANEPRDSPKHKKLRDVAAMSYKRALEFFDKCLQLDQSCAMAAHGAAIAMAERGDPARARTVFQDIPEPSATELPFADVPVSSDVLLWATVNVAHVHVETGNYRQAVLAYEATIDGSRFIVKALEPADAPALANTPERLTKAESHERRRVQRDLHLYLATKDVATMRTALTEIRNLCSAQDIQLPEDAEGAEETSKSEEAKDPEDAKKSEPASRLQPEDSHILFDQALIEQAVAQMVSEQPETQRTLADIDFSTAALTHSTRAFTFLAAYGKPPKAPHAHPRATFGKSLATKLERKRTEQEVFERERQQHLDEWRRKQEREQSQRRDQEERQRREMLEREARMLRETEQRNAVLRQEMADAALRAATEAPKARARKQKDDGFISDTDDAEPVARAPASKPRKRKPHDEDVVDAEKLFPDARPVSKKALKSKKQRLEDAKADDYGKYKSKAIITDSDDDLDNDTLSGRPGDVTPEPRDSPMPSHDARPKAIIDSDDEA
ncbi:TPR-like protein [Linderina pennispora]|uniref:TPR-like protein n=1 Tax=Linderina pennispora TaxID=61395 RepID=A0A1Y1WC11_9FUNG|nr:TPR-like protein [Linderina pennispora]ORX71067.1 TPR-like protein [Linderina pennispora]